MELTIENIARQSSVAAARVGHAQEEGGEEEEGAGVNSGNGDVEGSVQGGGGEGAGVVGVKDNEEVGNWVGEEVESERQGVVIEQLRVRVMELEEALRVVGEGGGGEEGGEVLRDILAEQEVEREKGDTERGERERERMLERDRAREVLRRVEAVLVELAGVGVEAAGVEKEVWPCVTRSVKSQLASILAFCDYTWK